MKTAGHPLRVKSANGSRLQLEDGRSIVDCISSWWVTLHGHGNEVIAKAVYDQALQLEHVIFAGFTHEPAESTAAGVMRHLPSELTRIFFSDNGSTSVEVALKMAYQYWRNVGQSERTKFIGFEGGYHGDTLGAMSAGGSSPFWAPFQRLMFPLDSVPFPDTFEGDTESESKEQATIAAMRALLEQSPREYAAIIIEPLVQGAAGMRMCTPRFLQSLRALANEFDVLLIFDEVMTGFGRTGDWFACMKAKVVPDIICLSKGITGGFLPLSVTLCIEKIYQAFYSDEFEKALFHSHSYTGNPLACAAAKASMTLLENNPALFFDMETRHRRLSEQHLLPTGKFTRIRYCGTIAAFDIKTIDKHDYFSKLSPLLRSEFLKEGLLLRPLGNTIYFMPPLCTDDETLNYMYTTVARVVSRTTAALAK